MCLYPPTTRIFQNNLLSLTFVSLLSCTVFAQVPTQHNDNARSGQNLNESTLNTTNVNSSSFGLLHRVTVSPTQALQGQIYAQPLFLPIGHYGTTGIVLSKNTVYVATEDDWVYAIDADGGTVVAMVSLLGNNQVPASSTGAICPSQGVTGTPVIDTSTGTLYVIAKSKDMTSGTPSYTLHALTVDTLTETMQGPYVIQPAMGAFAPGAEIQRPGLLLLQNGANKLIYAGFSSEISGGHGLLLGLDATNLQNSNNPLVKFETVPDYSMGSGTGGVWMSGGGIAADSNGNIYFSVGDGYWDGVSDFGDSVVKLSVSCLNQNMKCSSSVSSFFTPSDQGSLDSNDYDLGSGGVVLLPDGLSSKYPHEALAAGKDGNFYLLNRDSLGGYSSGGNTNLQTYPNMLQAGHPYYASPSFWTDSAGVTHIYYAQNGTSMSGSPLSSYTYNSSTGMVSTPSASHTSETFGFPGPTPSVSANGSTAGTGIVWVVKRPYSSGNSCSDTASGTLYAYDATDLTKKLFDSTSCSIKIATKFSVPTIANGKVFVGSAISIGADVTSELDIFGLNAGSCPQ